VDSLRLATLEEEALSNETDSAVGGG